MKSLLLGAIAEEVNTTVCIKAAGITVRYFALSGGGVDSSCDDVYRLREGVFSVSVEDENILLAMDSGKYFGVRGAMRHLLESLREGLSMDAMVADTSARYSVTSEIARQDLDAMLPKLIDAGIVERVT